MSYLVSIPHVTDVSLITVKEVESYPTLQLGDIRYFNFLELIALTLESELDQVRETGLFRRVRNGNEDGLYIDQVPDQFSRQIISLNPVTVDKLAAIWSRKCYFERYNYIEGEHFPPLLRSLAIFASEATESDEHLYYVQIF